MTVTQTGDRACLLLRLLAYRVGTKQSKLFALDEEQQSQDAQTMIQPEFPNLLKNKDFNEEKEASQDTKGGEKWNKIMGCHTFER